MKKKMKRFVKYVNVHLTEHGDILATHDDDIRRILEENKFLANRMDGALRERDSQIARLLSRLDSAATEITVLRNTVEGANPRIVRRLETLESEVGQIMDRLSLVKKISGRAGLTGHLGEPRPVGPEPGDHLDG